MDLSSTSPANITTTPPTNSDTIARPQDSAPSDRQQDQSQQPLPTTSGAYPSPNRPPKKSSSTCTTCRARKVRCNGIRPICSNCQRLGFPCSYDDESSDPAATAAAWSVSLPRRRVKQACLSCHSRKARCSGHMPACDRCRAQAIECVYRPTKRARVSTKSSMSAGRHSPQSHDDESHRDDGHNNSDTGFPDISDPTTPNQFNNNEGPSLDESFDSLISRTFEKFFRNVHHIPSFDFLHRASLMGQYHLGKVDRPLLLALVGVTTYLTDMGPGLRSYGARCIDEAESLILSDYARPSTIKVQALVLMIKYRILSNRFQSAFFLLGIASRFAVALRLNYDSPNVCFLAQESRRRLMWAIYCIDAGISGGNRDYSLWRSERLFLGLPCNERNFEFDLPQETEKLIPDPDHQRSPQAEDIGSVALHIRIQHIRHKISEFTKEALGNRDVNPRTLQTSVLSLHGELEDFAAHLPASFQFSEKSLQLRAYSPRICVFLMIHVWWRQCHCDLYRLGLVGLREALSRSVLENFDESFIEHCQRQCVDHAIAMANIFLSMQKLHAKPVADLDLALCAYQCTRMLKYAYHAKSGNLNLTQENVMEHFKVCLQAVKDCCMGAAAAGIRSDIEKVIAQGLGPRTSPARMTPPDLNTIANVNSRPRPAATHAATPSSRPSLFKDIEVPDDGFSTTTSAPSNRANPPRDNFPPVQNNVPAVPQAIMTDAWTPPTGDGDVDITLNDAHSETLGATPSTHALAAPGGPSELNNAFEGAMDGLGLDHGLDYSLGIDVSIWGANNGDWRTNEFMNGGSGVGV
ncbi:hypothetical protein V2G26_016258 [Clonostachys chloroleuca]